MSVNPFGWWVWRRVVVQGSTRSWEERTQRSCSQEHAGNNALWLLLYPSSLSWHSFSAFLSRYYPIISHQLLRSASLMYTSREEVLSAKHREASYQNKSFQAKELHQQRYRIAQVSKFHLVWRMRQRPIYVCDFPLSTLFFGVRRKGTRQIAKQHLEGRRSFFPVYKNWILLKLKNIRRMWHIRVGAVSSRRRGLFGASLRLVLLLFACSGDFSLLERLKRRKIPAYTLHFALYDRRHA